MKTAAIILLNVVLVPVIIQNVFVNGRGVVDLLNFSCAVCVLAVGLLASLVCVHLCLVIVVVCLQALLHARLISARFFALFRRV